MRLWLGQAPTFPCLCPHAVLPGPDSFPSLSLTFASREMELGFSPTLPLPTSHFLPLPRDQTSSLRLPVPATTDDRSVGGLVSRSGWGVLLATCCTPKSGLHFLPHQEPAYLSPHSASECLCWDTLSTCLLPLSLRFLIREMGPSLTSGQSWVGVWMPLLEESPSRWTLHLVHLCLHTSPGLDRQDTGISGSLGNLGQ